MKAFTFITLATAAFISAVAADDIDDLRAVCFNATHCSCSQGSKPGTCYRFDSGTLTSAVCTAGICNNAGHSCDCLGKDICLKRACGAWKVKEEGSNVPVGSSTECKYVENSTCASKLEIPGLAERDAGSKGGEVEVGEQEGKSMGESTASQQETGLAEGAEEQGSTANSTTSQQETGLAEGVEEQGSTANSTATTPPPVVKKMVQFGPNTLDTLWDMKPFIDVGDEIAKTWKPDGVGALSMSNKWPDNDLLHFLQLNFRLYQSEDGARQFFCMIVNKLDYAADASLEYVVRTRISAVNPEGQIAFVACDDWKTETNWGECKKPLVGNTLSAYMKGLARNSDGWCVSPLSAAGAGIKVEVLDISNIVGVNFQGSDNKQTEYMFAEGKSHGMTGNVDGNGLVQGGALPDIIVDVNGIALAA